MVHHLKPLLWAGALLLAAGAPIDTRADVETNAWTFTTNGAGPLAIEWTTPAADLAPILTDTPPAADLAPILTDTPPAASGAGVPAEWNSIFTSDGATNQIGATSSASEGGTAIGYAASSEGWGSCAIGNTASALSQGAALGYFAAAGEYGCAFGYAANAIGRGISIGVQAYGNGVGNVCIGTPSEGDEPASANPSDTFSHTCELGAGTATLNGALHYRGHVICDGDGVLLVKGSAGDYWHLAVNTDGTLYATNPITADGQQWSAP